MIFCLFLPQVLFELFQASLEFARSFWDQSVYFADFPKITVSKCHFPNSSWLILKKHFMTTPSSSLSKTTVGHFDDVTLEKSFMAKISNFNCAISGNEKRISKTSLRKMNWITFWT